jgi:putative ABC transport system permease protein
LPQCDADWWGIALGLASAVAFTRYLRTLLFKVSPLDVTSLAAAVGIFAAVGTVASFVPARRATDVDPIVALRCE